MKRMTRDERIESGYSEETRKCETCRRVIRAVFLPQREGRRELIRYLCRQGKWVVKPWASCDRWERG